MAGPLERYHAVRRSKRSPAGVLTLTEPAAMVAHLLSQVTLAQDLWPRRRMSLRSPCGRGHDLQARLSLRQVSVGMDRSSTASDRRSEGGAPSDSRTLPEVQGPALEQAEASTTALLKSCEQIVDEQCGVQWPRLWPERSHLWTVGFFPSENKRTSALLRPSSTHRSATGRTCGVARVLNSGIQRPPTPSMLRGQR